MIGQKEAMFAAIQSATDSGLTGQTHQDFAVEQVKLGLMSGEIKHKQGALPEKEATSYAKQLYKNWMKKDERISGAKYVPATKRGPINKDVTLRTLSDSLKSLRVNQPDNVALIQRVEAAMAARKAEIDSEKAKTKVKTKVKSLDETIADLAALGIDLDAV